VAREFLKQGYTNIFALKGGWQQWLNDKYPVENK